MQNLNFTFTKEQAEIILKGLGKLPAEISLNLILSIQKDGAEQIALFDKKDDKTENELTAI